MATPNEITGGLALWSDGQEDAERELMRLVVPEMRKLARRFLRRERPNHTLQPTALVNEAYILLIDARQARCPRCFVRRIRYTTLRSFRRIAVSERRFGGVRKAGSPSSPRGRTQVL